MEKGKLSRFFVEFVLLLGVCEAKNERKILQTILLGYGGLDILGSRILSIGIWGYRPVTSLWRAFGI